MSTPAPTTNDVHFTTEQHPLLLFYDGECSFCNRWVGKVKNADHAHRMRYGQKQGLTFQQVAAAHPEVAHVDSMVLVQRFSDGSERCFVRSRGVRETIRGLPEFRPFEILLMIFPTFLADIGYAIFSKLRGLLFGRWHHLRAPIEQDEELYVA